MNIFDDSEDDGEIPEFYTQESYVYRDEISDSEEEDGPEMEQLLDKQRRLEKSTSDYVLKTFDVREFGSVRIRFGKSQWKNARLIRKFKMNSVKHVTTTIKHHTVFIGFALRDTLSQYTFDIFIYFNTEDDRYFIDSFEDFLKEKKVITMLNKSYERFYLNLEPNYRVLLKFPEEYHKVVDCYEFKLKNDVLMNSRGNQFRIDGRLLPTETITTTLTTKHFVENEDGNDYRSYDKNYIKCKLLNNIKALLVYIQPILERERSDILRTKRLKLKILDKPSKVKYLEINKASLFEEPYQIYKDCRVRAYNGQWYKVVLYANKDVYPEVLRKNIYQIEPTMYVKYEMEGLRSELKKGMMSHAKIHKLEHGNPFFVKKKDNDLHIKLEGVDASLLGNLYFMAILNTTTFSKRIEADSEGYFDVGGNFRERHLRKGWFSFGNKNFERFSKFSGTLHSGMIAFRNRKSKNKLPSKKRFGKVVFEYFSRE